MKDNIMDTFLFEEQVLNGTTMNYICAGTAFLLNGAPPRFCHCNHTSLDREFSGHWIGKKKAHFLGPPCYPDFTRIDF
jgi:hypothetical protein